MKTSSKYLILFGAAAIGLILGLIINSHQADPSQSSSVKSIDDGQGYYSTTTAAAMPNYQVMRAGYGIFGSVVITGSTAGTITVYDATTTDATKRTNPATTTLAIFPASVAAGTYTFDSVFTQGLLIQGGNGAGSNYASSTITWR